MPRQEFTNPFGMELPESTGSDLADATAHVEYLKTLIAGFNRLYEPMKNELKESEASRDFLYQQFLEVERKVRQIETELNAHKQRMERLRLEIDKDNALIEQLMAAQRARQKAEEIIREFDAWAVDKYWFAEIKKHQFDGAKLMTYNRRVIVADVMGLGKTLEAIASVDLIAESTKDGDIREERDRPEAYWDTSTHVVEEPPAGHRV